MDYGREARADRWLVPDCRSRASAGASGPIGYVEVTLYDRWRLEQARLTRAAPGHLLSEARRLQSQVVLSKLPVQAGRARRPGRPARAWSSRGPEFVPGDRQRQDQLAGHHPRGTLQLNIFNAERAQVTVLLMDVSTDVGEPAIGTADLAVRAATGTAVRYLAARDRVGLISFGRRLDWIAPAAGGGRPSGSWT